MLRTQIYLPENLRKEIERYRAQTGESLAEYIRKAAEDRTKKDKMKKVDLKKLAEEITAGVKTSGWGSKDDILKWQREIRKDRKIL